MKAINKSKFMKQLLAVSLSVGCLRKYSDAKGNLITLRIASRTKGSRAGVRHVVVLSRL